jgi:hypothetical protein
MTCAVFHNGWRSTRSRSKTWRFSWTCTSTRPQWPCDGDLLACAQSAEQRELLRHDWGTRGPRNKAIPYDRWRRGRDSNPLRPGATLPFRWVPGRLGWTICRSMTHRLNRNSTSKPWRHLPQSCIAMSRWFQQIYERAHLDLKSNARIAWTSQRDTIAHEMRAMLDGAAFGDIVFDEPRARELIARATMLLEEVHGCAADTTDCAQ